MSLLVLVPTPIGNLDDLTFRARDELRRADVVAAEDTRRSGRLLAHYGIDTEMVRLDAHTARERAPRLLDEHARLAFVSDAGSPGISDPGAELVEMALAGGHRVEALPGATALVPALVLSGLPTARFAYEGFLPRKGAARRRRLEAIASRAATTVLFESPRRVLATLRELATYCGEERRASVSRELSKLHEETRRGTVAELVEHFDATPPRGEIVVVIGPAAERGDTDAENARHHATARALRSAGIDGRTLRDALVALGVPRNDAYRLALGASDES